MTRRRTAALSEPRPPDLTGRFVKGVANGLGYGRCVRLDGDVAEVQYTDVPDRVVHTELVPVGDLREVELPEETRVWVRNKYFGWWPGRVQGVRNDGWYLVRLPELDRPVPIDPSKLHVRWDRPLGSAGTALAAGLTDAPVYYQVREPVVRKLVEQRSACRGFTAALSAPIRPFRHQLEVLARVLGDPAVRFVLADEVGLGKTIEAGLVIRQTFLDDPTATVTVAVPRPLVGQWIDELRTKLLLGPQLDAQRLRVVEHDDLSLVPLLRPHMLVIDEAHRPVERALADPDELAILEAASATPALLLLTATPLRGHASVFLGLLHLIDPAVYDLAQLADFERRLAVREHLASSIELIVPELPAAVVRGVLTEFERDYPDDQVLQHFVGAALEALDQAAADLPDRLERVASHLRESYRVSRRVIRNRRSVVIDEGFPVSGRRLELVVLDDPCRPVVDDFLDDWLRLLNEEGDADRLELAADGVEAGLAGPASLAEFIERRLRDRCSPVESALLKATRATLEARGTGARADAVLGRLQSFVQHGTGKAVVFSGDSSVAKALAARLVKAFGRHAVATHLADDTHDAQTQAVNRFLTDPLTRVLVCDRSGEEGRNLQTATELIHLDLPLSVNRLEQRIGRADRFNEDGNHGGVPSVVFVEPSSHWVQGFLRLVCDGVGVFERSVATLQRPLAELARSLEERLVPDGADAFAIDLDELRRRLADEQNEIELLEELEATYATPEFTPAAFAELVEFEDRWGENARVFDCLTSDKGGLRLRKVPEPDRQGVFRYGVDPAFRTVPLMRADELQQLAPLLKGRRTFSPALARRHPGVQPALLGDPLVDWIDQYLRRDERGRTRAVWRHVAGWELPELWFTFDVLVEFDDEVLTAFEASVRRRLRRRGDAHLPPRLVTVHTDGSSSPDAARSKVLEITPAEQAEHDVELRGPRWQLALETFPDWSERCERAAAHARSLLMTSSFAAAERTTAVRIARDEFDRRLEVLRLRADRGVDGAREELATERRLREAVTAGLSRPRQTLVAAGATLIAGRRID